MRILFISNYDAWERVGRGVMPSHHLFGVYEMIEHFVTPNSAILKAQYGGGKIDFIYVQYCVKLTFNRL